MTLSNAIVFFFPLVSFFFWLCFFFLVSSINGLAAKCLLENFIMHLIGIDQMKHKTEHELCQYICKFMSQHQPVALSIVHTVHPCGEAPCDCQSACNSSYYHCLYSRKFIEIWTVLLRKICNLVKFLN